MEQKQGPFLVVGVGLLHFSNQPRSGGEADGCGAKLSTEWKMPFYKPEATKIEFVMDYKEWDESARSKGMLKSGVPMGRYVVYEWLEGNRANTYLI